jgi:hypothetical protein
MSLKYGISIGTVTRYAVPHVVKISPWDHMLCVPWQDGLKFQLSKVGPDVPVLKGPTVANIYNK